MAEKELSKESGILLLIDMVEFTPQSKELGGADTARLTAYFEAELKKRSKPQNFSFIKSIGDAALLFSPERDAPEGLVDLMLDLFTRNPIPPC